MVSRKLNDSLPVSGKSKPEAFYKNINFVSFIFCCTMVAGVLGVGDFRSSEQFIPHIIVASLFFNSMLIYYTLQLYLTYWLYRKDYESPPMTMGITVIVCWVSSTCFVLFTVWAIIDAGQVNAFDAKFRMHWAEHQPGFTSHWIAVIAEWFTVFSLTPFSFSLFNRMRKCQ